MSQTSNTPLLAAGFSKVIEEVGQNNLIHLREVLDAICMQLSFVVNVSASNSHSINYLDLQERTTLSLVNQAIGPVFERRRHLLLSQSPPTESSLTKENILETMKHMLFNQAITPDEGLAMIGELVSTVTYLRSSTVESPDQVRQIETQTLEHIKGKLSLALDAIQVEQGFVTKQ